jgi:hypothetical protein
MTVSCRNRSKRDVWRRNGLDGLLYAASSLDVAWDH